jgi:hypothetical protein
MLNSALKSLTLPWQTVVCCPRIATTKMAVLLIAKVRSRSLHLRADCHRSEPSAGFILGLRAGVGNLQIFGELIAKEIILWWQSAELERGGFILLLFVFYFAVNIMIKMQCCGSGRFLTGSGSGFCPK